MDINAGESGWAPAACTLPTAQQPLRVAAFDTLFAQSLRRAQRIGPDRLRLELDPSAAVAARAAELAAHETGCCSFFTFTLAIASGTLTLDVAIPDGQRVVLDGLATHAAAAAGTTA